MRHLFKVNLVVVALLIVTACTENTKSKMNMTKAIDPSNMDLGVKPGNDFFRYVNGGWMAAHPIPPEFSIYGAFHVLDEKNKKDLKALVDEVSADKDAPKGSIAQKIRDFYNSGMDTVRIERLGISAVQSELEAIDNLKTKSDVMAQVARMHRSGMYPLFYFYSSADRKNSSMEIANFYQGGLGLPDVDYYTNSDERNTQIREDYINHVAKTFVLAGADESTAIKDAQKVLELETDLAKTSKTRKERRIPEKNYHKASLPELKEISADIDWDIYFNTLQLPEPGGMNLGQKEFIAGISPIMEKYAVADWKIYLRWNLLNATSYYLSDEFVNQKFDFYGKTLSGQQELKPRWKRVTSTTSGSLGEAIGQLYVEKHFPPESKARMEKLVENLRLAFADRIKNLDWMSEETKTQALAKLESITVKIGYPDKWKDYSLLEIVPDRYLQNIWAANELEFQRELDKIGKPVDKTEWGMTPQTVNAYYNPTNNEIVFPAGILQPPFFNMDADDAVNYGAIGVVIGHEMTHGFDDQGRKYDKDGNMNDWWTESDAKRFEEKTKLLGNQYDKYNLLDSMHVDGALTMGENIADLGGLSIAYDAYQMSLNGTDPEPIDGFTDEQRFFMGYAQVWRQNIRDKELMRRLKEDVHSPGEARVNVPVFNLDVFISAFDIQPGDRLFIPEEERAIIW